MLTRIPRQCGLCKGLLTIPTATKSRYHGECRPQMKCLKENRKREGMKHCPVCHECVLFGDDELPDYHVECADSERKRRASLLADTPGKYYAVMLSDLERDRDTVFCYAKTEEEGRAMVRRLNAEVIAERGMPVAGKPIPLFFLSRGKDAVAMPEDTEELPSLT